MSNFLNESEQKATLEFSKLWMEANVEVLTTIVNRDIEFKDPIIIDKALHEDTPLLKTGDYLVFPLTISSGILGNIYLVFSREDLAMLVDLIIGGDGSSPMKDFDELHFSVLEEAINQIAGTLESILSENLMRNINVRMGDPEKTLRNLIYNWEMICLGYDMKIKDLNDLRMEILLPTEFNKELVRQINAMRQNETGNENSYSEAVPASTYNQGGSKMHRKAAFPQISETAGETKAPKIDLIMDIPLELTVVLGKTGISVKELIELGPGAVIELEKLAGEPVELFVNDRLVGYGEVIVIEENFGIRVIDVYNPSEAATQGMRGR